MIDARNDDGIVRDMQSGLAMAARIGGIWATLAGGGSGDRLARALERASAAPMPATKDSSRRKNGRLNPTRF